MSEIEKHIGKLKKVDLQGKSVEEWAKEQCDKRSILKSYHDTYSEVLQYGVYNKFIFVEDYVFEVIDDQVDEDKDISHIEPIGDDTYFYIFNFYNGGTCFSEMAEDALRRMLHG